MSDVPNDEQPEDEAEAEDTEPEADPEE